MINRVVYDCMIYLQAALRPERIHSTMRVIQQREVALYVSPEIVVEVGDVLNRPELQAKAPALTPERVEAFLRQIVSYATLISNVPKVYHLQRDPKDSKYINLALAMRAQRLVTWDKDLLYLMENTTPESREFLARYAELRIVDPPTFIQELEQQKGLA